MMLKDAEVQKEMRLGCVFCRSSFSNLRLQQRCGSGRFYSILLKKYYQAPIDSESITNEGLVQPEPEVESSLKRESGGDASSDSVSSAYLKYANQEISEPSPEVMFPSFSNFAQPENAHCSTVTLLGIPNSGKSTLTNNLVGDSVSIVTPKAQTTRERVLAILTAGHTQLIFQDTPGIVHAPYVPRRRKNVQKQIIGLAMDAVDESDLLLCVVDGVRRPDRDLYSLLDRIRESNVPREQRLLVINKSDLSGQRAARLRADELMASQLFAEAFCVSALRPSERKFRALQDALLARAVPGPWFFPPDMNSEQSLLERAEEIIRQHLYRRINQELPYTIEQRTDGWTELKNGDLRIDQTVLVPNERVKRVLIGKGGKTIRQINMSSRLALTELLQRPVHLFLFVRATKKS